jgi:hypothetical protein
VFSAIANATVPLPVPAEPEVIVTNEALDDAVQPHPAAVVTPTDALAPVPAMFSDVVDTA